MSATRVRPASTHPRPVRRSWSAGGTRPAWNRQLAAPASVHGRRGDPHHPAHPVRVRAHQQRRRAHLVSGAKRQRDDVLVQRHRPDRRGVELTLELGGPDGGIAGGRRARPAGDRERSLQQADAPLLELPGELPERGARAARAVQRRIAAQLQSPGSDPLPRDRVEPAVADYPGGEPGAPAHARAGEAGGEERGGGGRDQRRLREVAPVAWARPAAEGPGRCVT